MLGTAALPAPRGMGGVWMAGVTTFGVAIIDIEQLLKVLQFFYGRGSKDLLMGDNILGGPSESIPLRKSVNLTLIWRFEISQRNTQGIYQPLCVTH